MRRLRQGAPPPILLSFDPPPQTDLEINMLLAQTTGSLSAARALSAEDAMFRLEVLDHQSRRSALLGALGQLAPPLSGDSADALRSQEEWQEDYDELMLSLVREECCHSLPLDHEFGERPDYREPGFWRSAPGVSDGV